MKKIGKTLCTLAAVLFSTVNVAFAGQWMQDEIGWWYQNDDGSYLANCWQWIDGNNDGCAECYRFDERGYMLRNTRSDHGYFINEGGAWEVKDVVQTKYLARDKKPDYSKYTPVDMYRLWPDPVKLAHVEECKKKERYKHAPSRDEFWYVRLDIDYDTFDLADEHISEEMQAVNGYLWTMEYDKCLQWVREHTNMEKQRQDREYYEWLDKQGFEYYSDRNVPKELKAVIDEFVDTYITEDMTDFEKEVAIIKYMCENIEYDYESYENKKNGGFGDEYTGDSYGALVEGDALCSGYANAFYDLCNACGIKSNVVHGSTDEGAPHAWNMIKLDDGWYWVDVTWADNDYYGSSYDKQYINCTSQSFSNHKAKSVERGVKNLKATGEKYGSDMVEQYFE